MLCEVLTGPPTPTKLYFFTCNLLLLLFFKILSTVEMAYICIQTQERDANRENDIPTSDNIRSSSLRL